MSDQTTNEYESSLSLDSFDLKKALIDIIRAKEVPMVHGHPGIGKSAIAYQICEEFGLEMIDIRLSQIDPVDLNGFIRSRHDNPNLATYVPIDIFPLKNTKLPTGKNGWMIFLDELPSAAPAIQAAAYKLLLDRMVGNHKLHDKVVLMAAGNLVSSNAIAYEMGTATKSRLCHLILKSTPQSFLDWAEKNDVDSRIISFLRFKPTLVFDFDPNTDDFTFPCNRTWEKLSNIIKPIPSDELFGYRRKLINGVVGRGAATEFLSFVKMYGDLPTIDDIISNPSGLVIPQEPSVKYALTGMLYENIDSTNCTSLLTFINRLPIEFQIITMQMVLSRKKELASNSAVAQWIMQNANRMVKRNAA